jgi:hypothetical protein
VEAPEVNRFAFEKYKMLKGMVNTYRFYSKKGDSVKCSRGVFP